MRKEGLWVVSHLMNEVARLTAERDAWKADAERLAARVTYLAEHSITNGFGNKATAEILTAHDALQTQGEADVTLCQKCLAELGPTTQGEPAAEGKEAAKA